MSREHSRGAHGNAEQGIVVGSAVWQERYDDILRRPFSAEQRDAERPGKWIGLNSPDPRKRDATKKAEIEQRYAAKAERAGGREPLRLNAIALKEVRQLARYRYPRPDPPGASLPTSDIGRAFAFVIAALMGTHPRRTAAKIRSALESWASWMGVEERNAIAEKVLTGPWRFGASKLGQMLGVTVEERTLLGLTSMRPVGALSDRAFSQLQKARGRQLARERRREKGATPRARALTQTRPWEALGISRRTWERRGKPKPPAPLTQTRREPIDTLGGDELASRSLRHPTKEPRRLRLNEHNALRRLHGAPDLGSVASRALGFVQECAEPLAHGAGAQEMRP